MDDVLRDLGNQKYRRVTIAKDDAKAKLSNANEEKTMSTRGDAKIAQSSFIELVDVPVISPNNDMLIDKMSFKVEPGQHLMITGPNGCGKSALFRIIGELWPCVSGSLSKPAAEDIFYIPQRPYLPTGTLRDQIIYPDTVEQMKAKKITDNDLQQIMEIVRLGYIPKRESDGFDTVNDWFDVLSGGEKQRTAFARLIYHRPKFAILDECTSAVSVDVEGELYAHLKKMGVTMITTSHRETLWKYHDFMLRIKPDLTYTFGEMPAEFKQPATV